MAGSSEQEASSKEPKNNRPTVQQVKTDITHEHDAEEHRRNGASERTGEPYQNHDNNRNPSTPVVAAVAPTMLLS